MKKSCMWLAAAALVASQARAELPLPSCTLYGTIEFHGELVTSGEVIGTVVLGDNSTLEVTGEFIAHQGDSFYVLRIPMQTKLGAAGPALEAAQEGDRLASVRLDGLEISFPWSTLEPARVQREDIVFEGGVGELQFRRGDCDGSGAIDTTDPILTLEHLFLGTWDPDCPKACDFDDSGLVDITDAIASLEFQFIGAAEPRPPYARTMPEGCGTDPTPDLLTCASFPPCAGGGGGAAGGANGVAVMAAIAPESSGAPAVAMAKLQAEAGASSRVALARSARQAESGQAGYGVWTSLLDVSPSAVRMGATFEDAEKSFTLSSRASHTLELSLRSLSPFFDVFPSRLRLPAGGSLTAWLRVQHLALRSYMHRESIAMLGVEPAIEVSHEGETLARLQVDHVIERRAAKVAVGNGTVLAGTSERLALPLSLETSCAVETLQVRLAFDPVVFESGSVVAASGVAWSEGAAGTDGVLEGELSWTVPSGERSGQRQIAGHLLLRPRDPLGAGTYPVLLTQALGLGAEGAAVPVAEVHGEVCARQPWLDLDGDGRVLSSFEPVLAGRWMGRQDELWPAVWGAAPVASAELSAKLQGRADYLDVNASGYVDHADLHAITRGLSGLAIARTDVSGPDVAARIRNLHLPESLATVYPDALRILSTRLPHGTPSEVPVRPGEGLVLALLLDRGEPLMGFEALLRVEPAVLRVKSFEAGPRLEHAEVSFVDRGGESLVTIAPRDPDHSGIGPGLEPLGFLELEPVGPLPSAATVRVEIVSQSPGLTSGAATLLPVAVELALETCETESGDLKVRVVQSESLPLNHVRIAVGYRRDRLSLRDARESDDLADGVWVDLRDDRGRGEVTAVVHSPSGEPVLGDSPGGCLLEILLRRRVEDGEAAGDLEASDFNVSVRAAFLGPRPAALGVAGAIGEADEECCEDAGPRCHTGQVAPDVTDAVEVLEHVFVGATPPDCPGGCDMNCDGVLNLDDVYWIISGGSR